MNIIGVIVGILGLALVAMVIWTSLMSANRRRMEERQRAREESLRRKTKKMHDQDRRERMEKAENGHIPTILFLAKEGELRDLREALFWYEKAAILDNITGMYGVVRVCKRFGGDLVLVEKAKFWQRYIEGLEGSVEALYETGLAFISGLGVNTNVDKGLEVMERAARSQYVPAMLYLGDQCLNEDISSMDRSDANFWYAKAAKMGNASAMMKLGVNYINGVGTSSDHSRGCYWIESAAELGDTQAMYQAGQAWLDRPGNGNAIAYIWLYIATMFGNEKAKVLRDDIANKIGIDIVVNLQRFAKPLAVRIREEKLPKHLIIRALNRLYRRNIPLLRAEDEQHQRALHAEAQTLESNLDSVSEVQPDSESDVAEDDNSSFETKY